MAYDLYMRLFFKCDCSGGIIPVKLLYKNYDYTKCVAAPKKYLYCCLDDENSSEMQPTTYPSKEKYVLGIGS